MTMEEAYLNGWIDGTNLRFNWTITEFTQTKMYIQIDFLHPLFISFKASDSLILNFDRSDEFLISFDTAYPTPNDFSAEARLRRQMSDDSLAASLYAASSLSTAGLQFLTISNVAASVAA